MPIPRPGPLPWVCGRRSADVLERPIEAHPDRDALVFPAPGAALVVERARPAGGRDRPALIALGVAPGEHVGIWSMNSRNGSSPSSRGPHRRGAGQRQPGLSAHRARGRPAPGRRGDPGRRLPFKGSDFVAMVESLCPEVAAASDRRLVFASDFPAQAPGRAGRPARAGLADLERSGCGAGMLSSAIWKTESARLAASDVVNIQFTSGTTGLPKGAMLTHRNVLMNAYYVGERLRYTADDRVCVPVPFYHCFGCVLGTMVCAVYGATHRRSRSGFDPRATLAAIDSERCTSVYGVPTMFVAAARASRLFAPRPIEPADRDHVGSPCPLPLMERSSRDGDPRDLHRLRPDGSLADHHVHVGRRPDRSSRRDGRPSDPGT